MYHFSWVTIKMYLKIIFLTHWGRVTHICVSNLTIIGSDNGLSPGRHQAIIWTNAGTSSIGTLGTNFSEILIEILTFSFKNMLLKVSSGKWQPFCLGPNVLKFVRDWVKRGPLHVIPDYRYCALCTAITSVMRPLASIQTVRVHASIINR